MKYLDRVSISVFQIFADFENKHTKSHGQMGNVTRRSLLVLLYPGYPVIFRASSQ